MLTPPTPTRRIALVGAAATIALPARAQEPTLGAVADRARALDQLHALIVMRDGAEALALAPRGRGLDRVANVKSVSKTLLALLTGVAVERGVIEGPDARVLPLLGRAPTGDARDDLTIGHLLSMRTGLESVSGPRYGAWVSSRDWVATALAADLVDRPGGRFIYSTGGWHVLGAVLARAADRSLLRLAREWLGDPLEIEIPSWVADPQGRYLGGNDMALTPRALARVGEMVRRQGQWNGASVVPAAWIETSWEPRARSPWSGDAYGYGWFLTRMAGHRAAYGRGYGGQVLAVVPDLKLTIAITSDPTRPARSGGYFGDLARLMRAAAEAVAAGDA